MTIKTSNYTYDFVENYYIKNLLENDFWIFGSRSNREVSVVTRNTNKELTDFLSKTVFGLKLDNLDLSFMANIIFWTEGRIYDKYDDQSILEDKDFYVIIEPDIEGGVYDIFKCISNNYNAPSLVKPQTISSINSIDGIYNLTDGYVWKYMTSIPSNVFRKFSTRGFAPIPRNGQVEGIAKDGIDFIEVVNRDTNLGYQRLQGTINAQSEISIYVLNINSVFFEGINSYRDSVLYVESQESGVILYPIIGSRKVGQNLEVTLQGDVYTDFNLNEDILIEILPQIKINGNGTGAIAIPIFSGNRINGIRILNTGQGYTQAVAQIIDPLYFTQSSAQTNIKANIRPIISPKGGHGANSVKELLSSSIGLSASISSTNGTNIPDTNTYSSLGLVKNPSFVENYNSPTFDNRIKIELDGISPTSSVAIGDIVSQTHSGETITGIIHEIEGSNTIYLTDYFGPHAIEFVDDVPISVRNTIFNINTLESSGYINESGDIFYITDFFPVERTTDKTEQIKIILDF